MRFGAAGNIHIICFIKSPTAERQEVEKKKKKRSEHILHFPFEARSRALLGSFFFFFFFPPKVFSAFSFDLERLKHIEPACD